MAATPSKTSGPLMSRNSSASDASKVGPASRSQLLSASFVWLIAARPPAASRRVPCTRGCGTTSRGGSPASGGVWICAGCGRGILRPLLSALETSSPPLASLVILLSWDHALPCQCGREGLFISAGPRPSPIPPAKPVRQLCCMPRGVVRRASMHNLCSAPLATDTRATMSMYFGKSCVDGWEVGLKQTRMERPSSVGE